MSKLVSGVNDLKTWCEQNGRIDLLLEWDYAQNGDLKPTDVAFGTKQYVNWKCDKGHEWSARVNNRCHAKGCPYCSNQKVLSGFNDLATIDPELAAEWNYERNKGLKDSRGNDISTPDKIVADSNIVVWWKLPYDVPNDYPVESLRGKHFDFEWQSNLNHRHRGKRGCPFLSGKAVWSGFNDLVTVNPELAEEWDYEKNKGLIDGHGHDISTPDKIAAKSNIKVGWLGKCGHEWSNSVCNRMAGRNCPICNGERKTSFPEQCLLWYLKKNGYDVISRDTKTIGMELDIYIPSMKVAIEYDGAAWHIDKRDKELLKNQLCLDNDIFLIRIREPGLELYDDCKCFVRNNNVFGSIRYDDSLEDVIKSVLNYIDPNVKFDVNIKRDKNYILNEYLYIPKFQDQDLLNQLILDWHPTKNGSLKLDRFSMGSNDIAEWKCHICGHEWTTSISNRALHHSGCPNCALKQRYKKVCCIELNQVYESSMVAAKAVGLKSAGGIIACCKGKAKTSGGYHWKYVDKEDSEHGTE